MTVRWVTAFIDHPSASGDSVSRFWQVVTGSALSTRRGDRGQFATLLPPDGDPYLRLQETDDGSSGVHVDLHVDDVSAAVDRAIELGAGLKARVDEGLAIIESPGGLGFCFVRYDGEGSRPGPIRAPTSAYRFDQVSIDIPAADFDRECEFWSALTTWPLRAGSVPEFRVLARHGDMPIRFLLQRLGPDDDGRTARAHLDAAAGSAGDSIASWHVSLGATVASRGRHWITLLDPAGLPYCLTERDPVRGTLPDPTN